MLFVALALAGSLVYVPVFYWQTRKSVPPIHDITTDLDNPPAFSAVLLARAAERAGSLDRRTPQLAELQKAAYPDLAPLTTTLPPTRAFAEALEVAKSMPGWTIVAADANAGRIEASEQTRWFRFTDDVVIRVVGDGAGSRIDMTSLASGIAAAYFIYPPQFSLLFDHPQDIAELGFILALGITASKAVAVITDDKPLAWRSFRGEVRLP